MLEKFNNMQISFQGNILGFNHLNSFRLESIEGTPFAYIKSEEDENISFLTVTPFHWYPNYSIQLNESMKSTLHLDQAEDALILNIVTMKGTLEESTLNLVAPLIVNVLNGKGTQYVLQENKGYRTNAPLITDKSNGMEMK
ncbi:flagellar assembly protein FliW [Paenibacillus sp. EZ-K15]|uniref:flagellar assembly protein FliW n=1 Tax=Paenibacillus sp. EZ-K15 TaxID=2044275 RepID=UPI000BF5A323|nr:flagellar assembly protein FliW [Paenibacillus sp. EZ-K15]